MPGAEDLNANNDAYPLARPSQAAAIATLRHEAEIRERNIFVKPLEDTQLGPGYMRVTTARPEDNERVVAALEEIL